MWCPCLHWFVIERARIPRSQGIPRDGRCHRSPVRDLPESVRLFRSRASSLGGLRSPPLPGDIEYRLRVAIPGRSSTSAALSVTGASTPARSGLNKRGTHSWIRSTVWRATSRFALGTPSGSRKCIWATGRPGVVSGSHREGDLVRLGQQPWVVLPRGYGTGRGQWCSPCKYLWHRLDLRERTPYRGTGGGDIDQFAVYQLAKA